MDKAQAFVRAGIAQSDRRTIHFASVSKTKPVWWVEVPLRKLEPDGPDEINLLLYEQPEDLVHHLRVPADFLRQQLPHLDIRPDKQLIALQLSTERDKLYRNMRPTESGVEFGRFLVSVQ